MREKRGALGRTVGAVAESIFSAARGRQGRGETRVVIYDEAGHATRLRPGTDYHERLVEVAEEIVALVREQPEASAEPDSEPG